MRLRSMLVWFALMGLFFLVVSNFTGHTQTEPTPLTYVEFVELVESRKILNAKVDRNTSKLVAETSDNKKISVVYLDAGQASEFLVKHKVKFTVSEEPSSSVWISVIGYLLPTIVMVLFFVWIMRGISKSAGGGFLNQVGQSKAKLFTGDGRLVTFADFGGAEEVKDEIVELVDFLKNPGKYHKLGGQIPKGVLLIGLPGTGKTLLARAIAGEAGVPFFSISGSDFVEMFVGVGASRVRDLFERAKKRAPCIIFIDEIDTVGKNRNAGFASGGHDEREQTLNQLLAEMDGFEGNAGIIIMAATNRPEVLDPALLRPGRFNRRIEVPKPACSDRLAILKIHAKSRPLAPDVDLENWARNTPGFTGADLGNLLNEAAIVAARRGKEAIDNDDLEYARDKHIFGLRQRSREVALRDREITRFHEAGHAIAALNTPYAKKPRKVTIISRGKMGGFTEQVSDEGSTVQEKTVLLAELQVLLGGRAGEELFCNTATTGASDDLKRATKLATMMVKEFGMGDAGLVVYAPSGKSRFLPHEDDDSSGCSDQTKLALDKEIKRIIDESYEKVKDTLDKHRMEVSRLAALLEEREEVVFSDNIVEMLKK